MARTAVGIGRQHLAVLARAPRPAGSAAERAALDYASRALSDSGFAVRRERFEYSAFPGRYGMPIGGALAGASVLASVSLGLAGAPIAALAALAGGALLAGTFASAVLGDGVLTLPWLRAESENLVATRGAGPPSVWLVAHVDSKSQPVPSLLRTAGVAVLAVAVLLALVAGGLELASLPYRMAWWAAGASALLGALPVTASVVGERSDGAVDNASGVAAVLAAAALARPDAVFGVLIPSAEELGLAGVRAWARTVSSGVGTALNCDGVDDEGELTIMYSGRAPQALIETLRQVAPAPVHARRMLLGLATDSVALAERGWTTLTVSRGSFATLRRVHTASDSLAMLHGDGIDEVATLLARAVEALA
jgi:hypothetical protein